MESGNQNGLPDSAALHPGYNYSIRIGLGWRAVGV